MGLMMSDHSPKVARFVENDGGHSSYDSAISLPSMSNCHRDGKLLYRDHCRLLTLDAHSSKLPLRRESVTLSVRAGGRHRGGAAPMQKASHRSHSLRNEYRQIRAHRTHCQDGPKERFQNSRCSRTGNAVAPEACRADVNNQLRSHHVRTATTGDLMPGGCWPPSPAFKTTSYSL
jgi:hypothetical protein